MAAEQKYYIELGTRSISDVKSNTCLILGKLIGRDVVVKIVPNDPNYDHVIDNYNICSLYDCVLKLLLVEDDENLTYLAFDIWGKNLKSFTSGMKIKHSKNLLRLEICALQCLHENQILHRDLCPSHILFNINHNSIESNKLSIKFCGMGRSGLLPKSGLSFFQACEAYISELRNLKLLVMYLLVNLPLIDGEFEASNSTYNSYKKKLTPEAKDLIKAIDTLQYSSLSGNMKRLYNHPFFADPLSRLSLYIDVTDNRTTSLTKPAELDKLMRGRWDWANKVDGHWYQGMCQSSNIYDTTKLSELLRLIRNSLNHPISVGPSSKVDTLDRYLEANFPWLFMKIYNQVKPKIKEVVFSATYFKVQG